jgi:DNA invertase Pin-like site-specific DNA recombinase
MSPSKPKFVTYYRVSTAQQRRSALGLEAQQATAAQYLAAHGGVELASFTEVESGKSMLDRCLRPRCFAAGRLGQLC